MAVSMGAEIIEKHFTLDKNLPGPDHKASLEPDELKTLVDRVRCGDFLEPTNQILGSSEKKPSLAELKIAKIAKKSLIARNDIVTGTIITYEDIIIKRPGTGIPPEDVDEIVGKKAVQDIKKDSLFERGYLL
jgi:sialic acid synthase SpsE